MILRPQVIAKATESPAAPAAELERIRAEYACRASELPPETYSWDRSANFFGHSSLSRAIIGLLSQSGMFPPHGLDILDVGCGTGTWLLEFLQYGATCDRLHGIELLPERAAALRQRIPAVDLHVGDAEDLPWPDESMDLATQFVVFSSILNMEMKRRIASGMLRVLKPGGAILWHDFFLDNPRNPNVRGIGLREIHSLFPGCQILHRKVTLAPPIARAVVPISWNVACMLEAIPILRTHYLALIRKPSAL